MMRIVVLLCIGIVVLDAVESVISRVAGIPYGWFTPVQIVVYAAIGFAFRRRDVALGRTAAVAAITSLVEATLGQGVAIAIGTSPAVSPVELLVVIPLVVGFGTVVALAGFALGSMGRSARP
jgi:hypothetical protein